MGIKFSYIIPVYNRPEEVKELLTSFCYLKANDFEIIIVEDGSKESCESVIKEFQGELPLRYLMKENEGPGLTRNLGAQLAQGVWLIFLDSDTLLPADYQETVERFLIKNPQVSFFGGPDRDHDSFTVIQKAISFSMTSFFTTGGIRGSKKSMEKFKPRSFNMGVKRVAFEEVGGFSNLRFGEDMDISIRLEKSGFNSALIADAFVFHKRRTDFGQFFKQVYNSGLARIVLSRLHPGTLKVVHLLPFIFAMVVICLFLIAVLLKNFIFFLPLALLFLVWFSASFFRYKSFKVAFYSIPAAFVQLFGYGMGFAVAGIKALIGKPISYAFRDNFYQ